MEISHKYRSMAGSGNWLGVEKKAISDMGWQPSLNGWADVDLATQRKVVDQRMDPILGAVMGGGPEAAGRRHRRVVFFFVQEMRAGGADHRDSGIAGDDARSLSSWYPEDWRRRVPTRWQRWHAIAVSPRKRRRNRSSFVSMNDEATRRHWQNV